MSRRQVRPPRAPAYGAQHRARWLFRTGIFTARLIVVALVFLALVKLLVVVLSQTISYFESRPDRERITRERIAAVATALERWNAEFDEYPGTWLGSSPVAERNAGAETLFLIAKYTRSMRPHLGGAIRDVDGDSAHEPWDRSEIVDGWGNPLVYLRADAYAMRSGPHLYVRDDGSQVAVAARAAPGGYERPASYQLFSLGPDGSPNTDDDIVWR